MRFDAVALCPSIECVSLEHCLAIVCGQKGRIYRRAIVRVILNRLEKFLPETTLLYTSSSRDRIIRVNFLRPARSLASRIRQAASWGLACSTTSSNHTRSHLG